MEASESSVIAAALALLMDQMKLAEECYNSPVSTQHLGDISSSHCGQWRKLPSRLGLSTIIVDDICRKPVDEDEKRASFFTKWKEAKGSGATYKTLLSALLGIGCVNDAESVCKIMQNTAKDPQKLANHSASPSPPPTVELTARITNTPPVEKKHALDEASTPAGNSHNPGEEVCSTSGGSLLPYMGPEVREDVEVQLERNLEEIQQRYALFVYSLCKSVIQKGMTVKDLSLYLMNLPALECNDDKEKHKLLAGVKAKLQHASTIHEIFELLSKECASFLNYGVFQSILDDHKISTGNSDELNYSKHLKDYLERHRISEFVEFNPKLEKFNSKASKKLILKFNISLSSRVTRVLNLKKAVAKILRLKPSALQLVGVEEGCVVVTFLIPSFVTMLITEQVQAFKELPVLWLKCGDQEFHFEEKFSSPDDKFDPQVNAADDELISLHSCVPGDTWAADDVTNSLQTGSTEITSIKSFESFIGAKSYDTNNVPERLTLSDTEGSKSKSRSRLHQWEWRATYRAREFAQDSVAEDRMFMTTKARNLLRQRGMSYEEIVSAEWYMLPEAQKYLDGSMPSNSLELGSNVNQQHPFQSSDSGLGSDSSSVRRSHSTVPYLPDRERTAWEAATALLPNYASPLSRNANRTCLSEQRHASSIDDGFSSSKSSNLFISRRAQYHVGRDSNVDDSSGLESDSSSGPPVASQRSSHIIKRSSFVEQHGQTHIQQTATLIMYTLGETSTPFVKRLSVSNITLKDFKERVFARKGEYRFFFKSFDPDVKMELYEEFSEDTALLPLVDGKIVGRVEML